KLPSTRYNPSNLCALGFLTDGDRFLEMRNDIINDRIDVVTKGFLGLTVTCARCHDHKFDPIPTKDYYSLYGIFADCAEPPVEPVICKIKPSAAYSDYYHKRMALESAKETLEKEFRQARRSRNREAAKRIQKEERKNSSEVAQLELTNPGAPPRAMAINDVLRPRNYPVLIRGDAGNQGDVVPRRFLQVLSGTYRPAFTNGSGRLELAQAIISKSNPITPRVLVNRVWLHHFGEGFVSTPDDFGTMAEDPSHPELLDYLAAQFVEQGWSIKKLHREIMLSAVYQESSEDNPRYAQVDPANRLLWRANIRRLEFEALRDSLLAIGGDLDTAMYGRPVDLTREPYSTRRTIYGFVDRGDVADVLVNFDFANPDMPTGRRHETTVPQQALFLMNSPLVVEQAKKLVARPEFTRLDDDESKIKFLYERVYQRPPKPEEVELGLDFVTEKGSPDSPAAADPPLQQVSEDSRPRRRNKQKQLGRKKGGRQASQFRQRAPLKAWEEYAHALFQANEASFVN
ncbi:MAG TPA: DUF1553 domain-containing protein, partial [Verrucomicrobiae bacterium]|nr:DUF1553 domain-containing protein [Verrucomicrobiae bacterium]